MTLWLVALMVKCILASLHWPFSHDGSMLNYMVFLMDHGMAPYRDIIETSLPGSYFLYWFQRHTFGSTALAFRLFDLTGLLVAFGAMMVIARQSTLWFAGVFGSAFFLLSHTGGLLSLYDLGNRDFFMAVLLLCYLALIFESIRREAPLLMFGAGVCLAASCSIKPTALSFALILLLAFFRIHRKGLRIGRYIAVSAGGVLLCLVIVLVFLMQEKATGAFIHLSRYLIPLYADAAKATYIYMFKLILRPDWLLFPLAAAFALAILQPKIRSWWEQQMLFIGIILSLISYLAQGKGLHYHATPFLAFSYLWIGLVFVASLKSPQPYRWIALAALICCVATYPFFLESPPLDAGYIAGLRQDLAAAAPRILPGKIQCIEEAAACETLMDEQKISQATGFVQDAYLFFEGNHPIVTELRRRFLDQMNRANPDIVVLTNEQWQARINDRRGYSQLNSWPELQTYLSDNFHIAAERFANQESNEGYRIYVRNVPGGPGGI